MIKLIVSDIDGTLVTNDKKLPKRFWEVVKMMQEKGVRFCAASGRQVQSLEVLFKPIANEIGFISENGAFIKYKNNELHLEPLSFKAITPILETCKKMENTGVVLCGKDSAYALTEDKSIYEEIELHYPAVEKITDFQNINDTFFKITVCSKKTSKTNIYPMLKHFSSDFKVVVSGEHWLDITQKSVNKGKAVKIIQYLWGIRPEETAVFGDQLNDLEMMAAAKYSFAMKNAQPEVKQAANFITEYDNNNEGVIKKVAELLNNF
ncbi:HAD family hydrolase [Capnocytophaga canimorsus]|uniref:HAD family hydrolase n=1 Tax=Capnocytophaga canimorsus TaxID=28188 RepID=UPI0037D8F1FE